MKKAIELLNKEIERIEEALMEVEKEIQHDPFMEYIALRKKISTLNRDSEEFHELLDHGVALEEKLKSFSHLALCDQKCDLLEERDEILAALHTLGGRKLR